MAKLANFQCVPNVLKRAKRSFQWSKVTFLSLLMACSEGSHPTLVMLHFAVAATELGTFFVVM